MGWKNDVYNVIKKICSCGENFNLEDLYKYDDHFKCLYPQNNHIEEKIRQILQYLRDDGLIEFIDNNGEYKRIR